MRFGICSALILFLLASSALACDLCAVYSAENATGQSGSGFSFGISAQFIPYRTVQLEDRELPSSILDQVYLDRLMTHLAGTWNFSERFGVSLSVPVIHQQFRRFQLTSTNILTEAGNETDLGDAALIFRYSPLRRTGMTSSFTVNLLAGVKFPTGDADHVRDEVASTRELDAVYGPGHQHAVSGIHFRDLALGSGSFDGVFGITLNSRWKRWFFDTQLQYYLRTPGQSDYEFGDEFLAGGGPGAFMVLGKNSTLRMQALFSYHTMAQDRLLGRDNRNTGMTAWYLGPQLSVTMGSDFSAIVGVDIPLQISNHGLQNVPDYRLHGGLNYRF